MKIYHTPTQQAYDALMPELEEKGYEWLSGKKPTSKNYWIVYKEKTCINISSKYITFMNIEQSKKQYQIIPIIEYKAKGENMTQEEIKQNIIDRATDVAVAVESVARDIKFETKKLTVEADLQEAKSSAKKLIEKIDEYLEFLKLEFKVGDYITQFVNGGKIITKIDELSENKKEAHGLWYDKAKVNVKQDYWFLTNGNKFRHATPTEILEYEVALAFHKHGRNPFEVKRNDILRDDEGNIVSVNAPGLWNKENFTSGDYTFLKTAEEVNKWLKNK